MFSVCCGPQFSTFPTEDSATLRWTWPVSLCESLPAVQVKVATRMRRNVARSNWRRVLLAAPHGSGKAAFIQSLAKYAAAEGGGTTLMDTGPLYPIRVPVADLTIIAAKAHADKVDAPLKKNTRVSLIKIEPV